MRKSLKTSQIPEAESRIPSRRNPEACHQYLELTLEVATFLTVRVEANTFRVAADTAGRDCDDPQRDNLYEVEDTTEKLHGVLQHDILCVGVDTTGRLRGVFPLCNQEVLETLKDDSWVALEASRHGSLEVLEAYIQALFLVLREGFIKNGQINEIL